MLGNQFFVLSFSRLKSLLSGIICLVLLLFVCVPLIEAVPSAQLGEAAALAVEAAAKAIKTKLDEIARDGLSAEDVRDITEELSDLAGDDIEGTGLDELLDGMNTNADRIAQLKDAKDKLDKTIDIIKTMKEAQDADDLAKAMDAMGKALSFLGELIGDIPGIGLVAGPMMEAYGQAIQNGSVHVDAIAKATQAKNAVIASRGGEPGADAAPVEEDNWEPPPGICPECDLDKYLRDNAENSLRQAESKQIRAENDLKHLKAAKAGGAPTDLVGEDIDMAISRKTDEMENAEDEVAKAKEHYDVFQEAYLDCLERCRQKAIKEAMMPWWRSWLDKALSNTYDHFISYDSTAYCTFGGGETAVLVAPRALENPKEFMKTDQGGLSLSISGPYPGDYGDRTSRFSSGTWLQQEVASGQKIIVVLTVKATETVMAGGSAQTVDVPETIIRLDVYQEPELPLVENEKDDTGFADSPFQGLTASDGTLSLTVPGEAASLVAASFTPQELEIDMTPQTSQILQVSTGPQIAVGADPATFLPSGLMPQVTHSFPLGGNVICIAVSYPPQLAGTMDKLIKSIPGIGLVEINFCRSKQQFSPNDHFFKSKSSWGQGYDDQWALKRIGFTADDGSAWNLVGENVKPVVVAVIDSGLDWNHRDIAWDNIWKNKGEIPDNGMDDDNNGYVDDVIGWDFIQHDNKPWDRDGHGTFVAGVIAARQGNREGIAGINPYARIMVLKALNDFGHTRASFLAEAIMYAANNNARVINLSVGGKNLTKTEQMAIEYAHSKGVVTVVAAGNEGIDVSGFGLAASRQVITVAASDVDDKRAVFSNWGAGIDITAPGIDVLSLRARGTDLMRDIPGVKYEPQQAYIGDDTRYYRASGTSFSAPLVAGTASLLLSTHPELSGDQVKRMLLHSAQDIEVTGVDQYTGYGILDARQAMMADPEMFILARIDRIEVIQEQGKVYVRVSGTADADKFSQAWIDLGPGEDPTEWKQALSPFADPVPDGILAELEASLFSGAKKWTLRLVVKHQNGRQRTFLYRVSLG